MTWDEKGALVCVPVCVVVIGGKDVDQIKYLVIVGPVCPENSANSKHKVGVHHAPVLWPREH